jgi:hypothetical protein
MQLRLVCRGATRPAVACRFTRAPIPYLGDERGAAEGARIRFFISVQGGERLSLIASLPTQMTSDCLLHQVASDFHAQWRPEYSYANASRGATSLANVR